MLLTLSMRDCYKLQPLHWTFSSVGDLKLNVHLTRLLLVEPDLITPFFLVMAPTSRYGTWCRDRILECGLQVLVLGFLLPSSYQRCFLIPLKAWSCLKTKQYSDLLAVTLFEREVERGLSRACDLVQ